ncbi:phenylalanine--tRNA ligase subunit beta [Staphylospora marina]|uniref:phenylalanine--tRNA ligase subunit beta n=1 Tax=Staphylospora marina TaxID=2490858 RepID=UPI000F5BBEFB|nr:phenylalanine--tRNA ligase subunit beta [Staphylospora marina]
MLVSYEWLSRYVELEGITPEDIAMELNRTGIEVEVIYTRDTGVSGVVIGQVLSVEKHPEADKLKVCMVSVGPGKILQIVCGASNVAPGQRVPVALVGAKLPGGVHIKNAVLRGVESQGMICSARELGLPDKVIMKEQTEGILVLGPDAPIGGDIKDYLGMNDEVIELQLTPNRSDCLSMFGVAYEVAAIFDRQLMLPEVSLSAPEGPSSPVEIMIQSEDDCPFYAAQVVHGIKIGPSPQWMQNRLISAGIRPINNVVDITNYVMLETGQPLHAFDYDKIPEGRIAVRRAVKGETLVTLDGQLRELEEDMLLITDGTHPIAVAGVMGGESSEVTSETVSVLIESAFFDPAIVRRGSRKLGLRTEASNRFEKGVDPERIVPALARAVELMEQLAGGVAGSEVMVQKAGDVDDVVIPLRHDRLESLIGNELSEEEVLDIFRRLRFTVESGEGVYHVKVPTRRPDVTMEVDLIEEVARLYGYERIKARLPMGMQSQGGLTREQKLRRVIRHTLRQLGLSEAITYSLTSEPLNAEVEPLKSSRPIRLAMPMSQDRTVLRTGLVPSLIQAASYNRNHGNGRVALFEMGKTYHSAEEVLTVLPDERWELAALIDGKPDPSVWKQASVEGHGFYRLKGILESLFTRLGISGVRYEVAAPNGFHPGRTAVILIENEVVGMIGQLHPKLAAKHDLEEPVVFQLDLATLITAVPDQARYVAIPRYPAVTRDLAVVVDQDVPAGDLEAGIRKVAGELLESVALFDVFSGERIGEGKKSVAFSLVYRAKDRTLTDEEVQEVHDRMVRHLEEEYGAMLRQ